MQQYIFRDKGLSTTQGFVVTDQTDKLLFRADSKNWTLTKEYSLKNADGAELVHLKQKIFSLSQMYLITRDCAQLGSIRKCGGKYLIELAGQPPVVAKQLKLGMEFEFAREGKPIANVRRKPVSLTENCEVEIETGEDAEVILACLAAIFDMKRH